MAIDIANPGSYTQALQNAINALIADVPTLAWRGARASFNFTPSTTSVWITVPLTATGTDTSGFLSGNSFIVPEGVASVRLRTMIKTSSPAPGNNQWILYKNNVSVIDNGGFSLEVDSILYANNGVSGGTSRIEVQPGDVLNLRYYVADTNNTYTGWIEIEVIDFVPGFVETSYSNYLGTGNRVGLIGIETNIAATNGFPSDMFDGTLTASYRFADGQSGRWMIFDFGQPRLITEFVWRRDTTTGGTNGGWVMEGSNDKTNYDILNNDVDLGGWARQVSTNSLNNTQRYRYYRLRQVSGTTTNLGYNVSMTFKIDDVVAPPATSYANYLGMGDRRNIIDIETNALPGSSATEGIEALLSGSYTTGRYVWDNSQVNRYVLFDFGSPKLITGIRWWQGASWNDNGTWVVEGSNDNMDFVNVKPNFVFGGLGATQLYEFRHNKTRYRYYRLRQLSGTTDSSVWIHEIEFEIEAGEPPVEVTSLENYLGTGDRTGLISLTHNITKGSGTGEIDSLLDGALSQSVYVWAASQNNRWMTFDFGQPRVLTGGLWRQGANVSQGKWVWQGSNDRLNYQQIGGEFALGSDATQPFYTLRKNTTAYRFYRLLQVSGATSAGGWLMEIEFKLDNVEAVSTNYLNFLGTGDRRDLIGIETDIVAAKGDPSELINGVEGNTYSWNGGQTGKHITFDFGVPKLINEMRWSGNTGYNQGLFEVVGSNDNSVWEYLGPAFTLGGNGWTTISVIRHNHTRYRYYRLRQAAGGSTNGWPDNREIEFKIEPTAAEDMPALTSYANEGGSGNRTGIITTNGIGGLSNLFAIGNAANLIDGVNTNDIYFNTYAGAGVGGFGFDFGVQKVINEIRWRQSSTVTHGVWRFEGSNNNVEWTQIGTDFTLGGALEQIVTEINGNATAYRYYRMRHMTGGTSNGPWLYEVEFKIRNA